MDGGYGCVHKEDTMKSKKKKEKKPIPTFNEFVKNYGGIDKVLHMLYKDLTLIENRLKDR